MNRFTTFAVAAALLAAQPLPVHARAHPTPTPMPINIKIKQSQQKIEQTKQQLQQARGQLHQARFKVQTISGQLNETNGAISRVSGEINSLSSSIDVTERRLAIRRVQLAAVQASLKRHTEALDRRLVDIYEQGSASYLDVLLNSTSFEDFVERLDFLRFIVRSDTELIKRVNTEQHRYQLMVADLERTEADLDSQRADRETKRSQLSDLADRRRELLYAATLSQNVIQQHVQQLEDLTAAEEAQLQALIVERQREEAAQARQAQIAACAARRAAAAAAGQTPTACVSGHFIWPAQGPVVSGFGMRWHPILGGYRMHTGIDIGAPYGAPIVASDDGVVLFVGWYGGYGNTVIVDHGGGYSTLYAHCSSILVSQGQQVQRGQAIARVGATGYATGPHLHFEIRVNGVPINPMTRL
ncbi:MAG TPA: peptidoglycan DD-metalloendopeptidase family protein [Candidatus Binatus sp.]|nr:peptidoglycan DD-metalloendopeptidase family protein [Candidatus Binatus sp.]